jgi:hypothetical protein
MMMDGGMMVNERLCRLYGLFALEPVGRSDVLLLLMQEK